MAAGDAEQPIAGQAAALDTATVEPSVRSRHAHLLFEKLTEGLLIAQLVRDGEGHAIDWLVLDVNAAFARLSDRQPADMIGHTIRGLIPGFDLTLIEATAQIVAAGAANTFTRHVAALDRDYEGRALHLEDDCFAILLLEVTGRLRAIRQQEALLALGDQLREDTTVEEMARTAARIVGETMKVIRAGFGRIDVAHGTIDIQADWSAPGVASIAGVHRFTDYGALLGDLIGGDPLIVEDVRTDPRSARDPSPLLAIDVASLINLPVREQGRPVAAFFVHDRVPRRWTEGELIFLRKVADRVEVGVARAQAEAQQRVLNLEISHRLKNTLTMVQAIATQTLRRATDRPAVEAFEQRLGALATAHDVLLARDWASADLETVARGVLDILAAPDRCRIEGPPIALGPRAALSTSLLIHELGTNAVKYGALSSDRGMLTLSWQIEPGGHLVLDWREEGGPPANLPTRFGFGSRLIERGLIGGGEVDSRFTVTGFATTMRAPLADLQLS